MKAIAYRHSLPITDADALLDIELPVPVATGRDLLVAVHANAVPAVVDVRVIFGQQLHRHFTLHRSGSLPTRAARSCRRRAPARSPWDAN
ncbi:MAG: hypothetical protein RSH52_20480, partial [Janthinobacterium sp.]